MPYGNSKKTKMAWSVATDQCKKKGLTDFSAGSAGDACRKSLAERIAEAKKGRGER